MSATHATDIALRSDQSASVGMDAMTLVGMSAPLVLPFACESTVTNSQMNNVQLQVDSGGDLTVTGSTFRSEGLVVTVASGGVFTVASSQLLHDGVSDAFPCNGQNMHCMTDHAGSVMVHRGIRSKIPGYDPRRQQALKSTWTDGRHMIHEDVDILALARQLSETPYMGGVTSYVSCP